MNLRASFQRAAAMGRRVVLPLIVLAATLASAPSYAQMVCQELTQNRNCADNAPKSQNGVQVPAPVMPGFSTACWSWNRQFQCVDKNPTYYCESGDSYQTVQQTCNLVGAAIQSSTTINGIAYVTDAQFQYKCAYGQPVADGQLPNNGTNCAVLNTAVTESQYVSAAAVGVSAVTDGTSAPPTTAALTDTIATAEQISQQFVCYGSPATTCAQKCYQTQMVNGAQTQVEIPCQSPVTNCVPTGSQCNDKLTTNSDGSMVATMAIGPDGRCVDMVATSQCQSGPVPKCLTQDNCTLVGTQATSTQDSGYSLTQEQTYQCSNATTTCTQITNVSNCVHLNDAWGWDTSINNPAAQGLAQANAALGQLQGVEQGMNNNDPYIFSGQNENCTYPVGNFWNTAIVIAVIIASMVITAGATGAFAVGATTTELTGSVASGFSAASAAGMSTGALASGLTAAGVSAGTANMVAAGVEVAAAAASDAPNSKAFGNNCCKDFVIEGSEAFYKFGSPCTPEEVQLAVAKQKGLTHYLGEYCSKKAGFPLRQCVQMTQASCVFPDMLALIINEQGRQQLADIQAADPSTTVSSGAQSFALFASMDPNATEYAGMNNGSWKQLTNTNHSQVWYWQYPGYCDSTADQTKAYNLYMDMANKSGDLKGIQPDKMTKEQAVALIMNATKLPEYQQCPATAGTVAFLTCQAKDDTCDPAALPQSPSGIETDMSGAEVTNVDVNWVVQNVTGFYSPGQYGVTETMPSDSTFAAVTSSVNNYVAATGSCHTNGACLYSFAITNKLSNPLGAKKQTTSNAQFPLYTVQATSSYDAISYLSADGNLDTAAYMADPARGNANPTVVSAQRFIFHPFLQTKKTQTGNLPTDVLLEWAGPTADPTNPADDFTPLVVPTSLPAATSGWWPWSGPKAATDPYNNQFYLNGGCDPNSMWCNYTIGVNLDVPLHPWGSPQNPQCWGFTLQQMAALDFSKMDLSRWINSLDLGDAASGLSKAEASAMTAQVQASAQDYYTAMASGTAVTTLQPSTQALVVSPTTLPDVTSKDYDYNGYVVTAAVPSNWPQYFNDQPNNNKVTNAMVDWGDGSAPKAMTLVTDETTGLKRAYVAKYDYGNLPAGTYMVKVTLDTAANGSQSLSSTVRVTPDAGKAPVAASPTYVFDRSGADNTSQATNVPSQTVNGISETPENLQNLSPGTTAQFSTQGSTITTTPSSSSTTSPSVGTSAGTLQ